MEIGRVGLPSFSCLVNPAQRIPNNRVDRRGEKGKEVRNPGNVTTHNLHWNSIGADWCEHRLVPANDERTSHSLEWQIKVPFLMETYFLRKIKRRMSEGWGRLTTLKGPGMKGKGKWRRKPQTKKSMNPKKTRKDLGIAITARATGRRVSREGWKTQQQFHPPTLWFQLWLSII